VTLPNVSGWRERLGKAKSVPQAFLSPKKKEKTETFQIVELTIALLVAISEMYVLSCMVFDHSVQ
jgi:hypothetical protein